MDMMLDPRKWYISNLRKRHAGKVPSKIISWNAAPKSFGWFRNRCTKVKQQEHEMPKLKTNRGAAKRFRATGRGRIKRKRANHSHILTKKSTKRSEERRVGEERRKKRRPRHEKV